MFDEEFTGGKNLHGCCSPFRGRLVPWSGVLLVGSPPAQAPAAQGQQAVAQKVCRAFWKVFKMERHAGLSALLQEFPSFVYLCFVETEGTN